MRAAAGRLRPEPTLSSGAVVTWNEPAADGGIEPHASVIGPDATMVRDAVFRASPATSAWRRGARTLGLLLTSNDAGYALPSDVALYEGVPGEAFAPVVTVTRFFETAQADGCGRVVALSGVRGPTSATSPNLFAQAMNGSSLQVPLGANVVAAVLAPTSSGFVVFWFEQAAVQADPQPLALKKAPLDWQ